MTTFMGKNRYQWAEAFSYACAGASGATWATAWGFAMFMLAVGLAVGGWAAVKEVSIAEDDQ